MAFRSLKVVDLYSGCGGFGLGAELAGFEVSAAVDIDKDLQGAYRLNFPTTKTILADITTLDEKAWSAIHPESPIGVIGGPPCQGFSRMGKHRDGDPRNTLLEHYFRQVRILKPAFFVMENVEGLLDAANIDQLMCQLQLISKSYIVLDPMVVNAADYGAATERCRVIVIGYDPHKFAHIDLKDFLPSPTMRSTTVGEAIRDLPGPLTDQVGGLGWGEYPNSRKAAAQPSSYAKLMRRPPPPGLGSNIAEQNLAFGKLSGLKPTKHSEVVIQRFSETRPGTTEPISRYPRLMWNGICPTLRAGTGSDRGSYQSARPIHPEQPRVITVREAARLQGFPDWFIFDDTKWHSFRMIGNSVSPIVSQHFLEVLHKNIPDVLAA